MAKLFIINHSEVENNEVRKSDHGICRKSDKE